MDENFESKLRVFSEKLIKSAPLLCGILIAVWWIFYGMVEIRPTSLNITERIGLTICTVFMALSYCKLIAVGGFQSAKDTSKYVECSKKWTDAIKRGNPYKEQIIEYAKTLAKQNQKELRTKNLESVGLKYKDIFSDDGELIKLDYKKDKYSRRNQKGLFKNQIKVIRFCINIRVTVPEIFGSITGSRFGIKKEVSQKEYERKTDITQAVIRTVVSVFSVGMMFAFLGFSVDSLIYALFQIALWTGSGVSQRLGNYNFVINELLPQIVEKTLIIDGYLELQKQEEVK